MTQKRLFNVNSLYNVVNMKDVCILCNAKIYQKLFVINGFKIVKCQKCSLVFTIPRPTQKELDSFYKNFDYKTGFLFEEFIRQDARRSLKNLRDIGYECGSLLDVGCGAGFFLDEARQKGWNTIGVDTAIISTSYAKNKQVLNVIQKDIHKVQFKTRFTIVTLIQVIEHLTNPYPMLKKIMTLLDDDGIFCLATPNITSHLYNVLKEDFNYFLPPEHVIYYSPHTLKKLLEKAGFTVVKTITYGYPMDLGGIYRALRTKKVIKSHKEVQESAVASIQHNNSALKYFKSFVFEDIICKFGYPLLNISLKGSMIEMYAKKK